MLHPQSRVRRRGAVSPQERDWGEESPCGPQGSEDHPAVPRIADPPDVHYRQDYRLGTGGLLMIG